MSITGAQLVTDALLQATVLGLDQQIPDAYSQLALRRFNRMIDSWANVKSLIFSTNTESFTMVPNQAQYSTSLLASGRPVSVDSMWTLLNNNSYSVIMRDQQWYDNVFYKPVSAIPSNCFYNASMPDGQFNFYPTPYAAFTCNVVRNDALTSTVTLTTVLTMPEGYEKAFVDSLAVDVYPSFKGGKPIPKDLKDMAQQARDVLGITNYEPLEMVSLFGGINDNGSNGFLYKGF